MDGDVDPEEEKLLKQLASHKMILRDYPKMKTWWDAVKVWWQLKEGQQNSQEKKSSTR